MAEVLDGPVVGFRSAADGFSPGPAGRCELSDGRRYFLKACNDELSEFATAMHRREAEVLPMLPPNHPSPSLVATVDRDGWFALITDYVDGHTPTAPISPACLLYTSDAADD